MYDFRNVELLLSESPGNVTAVLGDTRQADFCIATLLNKEL